MLGLDLQRSQPMVSPAFSDTQRQQLERLLAAARDTIAAVPFCWGVTAAEDGGAHAPVVKAQPSAAGEDLWTRWFLTPRIGRKAAEIRRAGRLTLAYQHDSGNAYVALAGPAELIDDRAAVESRFRGSAYDDPEGVVAASLIAVGGTADHLELNFGALPARPWGPAP